MQTVASYFFASNPLTKSSLKAIMNIVQYVEVRKINTIVTSKEAIVAVCVDLAAQSGLQALNMRSVAEKCHVSVGSVYNYFPSKADLVAATVQSVWHSIFHMDSTCRPPASFCEYVEWIFRMVQAGAKAHPNFFTAHSMSFAGSDKGKGRQVMEDYFGHMKSGLLAALQNDPCVRSNAFDEQFTQAAFVDFVFSNLLSLLMRGSRSCDMLTEVITRTIY